jgi:hypothetical protein
LGEHGLFVHGLTIESQILPVYGYGQKQLNVKPLALGTHVPPFRHGVGSAGFVGHGERGISQRVPENNDWLHIQTKPRVEPVILFGEFVVSGKHVPLFKPKKSIDFLNR